jgi:hypothetical protein
MLITKDTNFRVQQKLGTQIMTLQLERGDLLIFKGDLVHSGGGSDMDNFRFFSYCATKKMAPEWWNKHKDGVCLPPTSKVAEVTVTRLNLRVVHNPEACNFCPNAYSKYLFCSRSNTFFGFDQEAYFLGIHTHESTDSVAYDGKFMQLTNMDQCQDSTKHCVHFPSNQQLRVDFPKMSCVDVAHWRTKCECYKSRQKSLKRSRQ